MIRVSLTNAFAKRTLRPLLEKHQATPLGINLLSTESGDIYSGMVAALTKEAGGTAGVVEIADNTSSTDEIFGLFALDKNAVINDLDGQAADMKPFAVWQGGPDAYFRIDDPAFETDSQTYDVGTPLFVSNNGKLCAATGGAITAGTNQVGIVTEVPAGGTRLIIRITSPNNAA